MGAVKMVRQLVVGTTIFLGTLAAAEAYSPRSTGTVRSSADHPFFMNQSTPNELRESAINYMLPGGDATMRQQSLEALVGSSIEPMDWPALPRVWWKFDAYDTANKNTYVGFQWAQAKFLGGVKHTYSLKYSRNVGLVLIGSLRSKDSKADHGDVDLQGQLSAPELVIEDSTSGFLYPNVRKGYPLVGMCVFELSMASEQTSAWSLDFMGSGHNQDTGRGFGTPYTLYSNFFQLDTEKPVISYYLKEHCQKKFEQVVRPWAEKQFEMAHRAYRTETRSQCKRERYGKDRLPEGDKDCLAWHQKTFPSFLTKDTVARCERGGDDLFHCVLKNKDIGATCPMRQDRQAKFMPSELPGNYQLRSFPCDDGKNLTCVPAWPDTTVQNIEQRKIFLGLDRTNAMGVCRSK